MDNHFIKKIFSHEGFQRYLGNSAWLFSERLLRIFVNIFVAIWVARFLGPQQWGSFNYIISFVAIFGSLAKLGLDEVIVRDLVKRPSAQLTYLGTVFWMKLIGASLSICLAVGVAHFAGDKNILTFYIAVVSCGLVFQSFEVIEFYFQSRVMGSYISICKSFQLFVSSLIKLALVMSDASLTWFVWALLFDQIVLCIAQLIAYRCVGGDSFFLGWDRSAAKQYLVRNSPLLLSGVVIMVYMRIDQIIIKELLGSERLGIYAAASRLSEVLYFFPMVISASLFPALVRAREKDRRLYDFRLRSLYSLMIWVGIIFGCVASKLSGWCVELLYGEAYADAGPVLAIQAWAAVFVFLGVASNYWLIAENLQKYALYRLTLGAVLNIVLNIFLIPRIGIIGAAMSAVLTQAFVAMFSDLLFRQTRPAFWTKLQSFNFFVILRRVARQ
jgi:O-antigen/teichoic acid export membrane protein